MDMQHYHFKKLTCDIGNPRQGPQRSPILKKSCWGCSQATVNFPPVRLSTYQRCLQIITTIPGGKIIKHTQEEMSEALKKTNKNGTNGEFHQSPGEEGRDLEFNNRKSKCSKG